MNNKNSIWLNITGVICYFVGIACISSLILLPLGIYCFIGGSRYFTWSTLNDVELSSHKNSLKNWAIFVSIVAFPIGLISVIPYFKTGNNPVVSDVSEASETKSEAQEKAEEMGIKAEEKEEPKAEHKNDITSKEETIAKLKKFKDDGLITDSEYKKALREL